MQILFIDHYDSFSFNVVDWLKSSDQPIDIFHRQYDDPILANMASCQFDAIVLSPGPNAPADVEPTRKLAAAALGRTPLLGICLGHQVLGAVAGFPLIRLPMPRHGTRVDIIAESGSILDRGGLRNFSAGVYNSLALQEPDPIGRGWAVTARSGDGVIQSIEYSDPRGGASALGLQFHPESFLTSVGRQILNAWLGTVRTSDPKKL